MNSRKVVFLFNSTFIMGTSAGFIIGLLLDWQTHISDMANLSFGGVVMVAITAAIWTVIAQMGFFAYLTIHRFGLGIFKSVSLWNKVQIVLIVFALFDLMFFRHYFFAAEGESMRGYAVMPLMLLAYGLIVAYVKRKETERTAFVPTVFFIVVVTTIEWIPALRENDVTFMINAIVPLLVANTWQILVLHRLHRQPNGKQPSVEDIKNER
ncbi:KinB-signaling pathway activation protein [Salipaludibacillus agaradhaerens]|uniref:KinB-signaling pathway activation protein n=1 Tax=Salipaludibacillus agaradhaerens TaxID=76935 RepID=A0A9Q4B574_SALAG|nr:KinB-signaling pathway activation protein [Salipaludibacillus agaradhaerens]MCR6098217.1 KinB-signaling pathway activation protein [Salipaludibacillus agaradhaerens]MCR6116153.1 KinB-signaling pathway activation protein [Salipaludibacillus agaradhaerens]